MKKIRLNESITGAVILAVVLLLFYSDVVLGGKTFLMENIAPGTFAAGPYGYSEVVPPQVPIDPGAMAWVSEPFNRYIARSLQRGDFPVWNPYAGPAGYPMYADGLVGPLEPLQWLFYWLPETAWPYGVDAQLLIRFWLAGFCCLLFARRLKIGLPGALAAGILYMLSSYFIRYGNHPQAKPELLLPLVLYGFERLADLRDKRAIGLCALSIGWVLLAAMPESVFFVLLLGSGWFVYRAVFNLMDAHWPKELFMASMLRLVGVILIGFALSAVYYLPLAEHLAQAASYHAPGTSANVFYPTGSLPGAILLLFRPYLSGFVQNYLGFIPIWLAGLAVVSIKRLPHRREVVFFAAYVGVCLLVIYGSPLGRWIATLPVFSQVIIAKYSVPSIMFCLALLAGIVVQAVVTKVISLRAVVVATALELAVFIGLPYLIDAPRFAALFSGLDGAYLQVRLVLPVCCLVLALLAATLYHSRRLSPPKFQLVLLGLILLDPFFSAIGFRRPVRTDPYAPPPLVQFLQQQPQPYRIFASADVLHPNVATAYEVADLRWLYALVNKRAYGVATRFIAPDVEGIRFTGGEQPLSTKLFDLLNVKYVISRVRPTTGPIVYAGDDGYIVENQTGLPRAFVVHQILAADSFDASLQLLGQVARSDLGRIAVVEGLPADEIASINQAASNSQPVAADYVPLISGRVEIKAESSAPGLLVVSDQYYSGWKAEVDGVSTPIYAVDGLLRGVFLPAGQHRVVMIFDPDSLKVGAIISLAALALIGYLLSTPIFSKVSAAFRRGPQSMD